MDSMIHMARKALVFPLEEKLEADLAQSLAAAQCESCFTTPARPAADGDLVFCTAGPQFQLAKLLYPHLPVIVVSRLPEANKWLDALEAGAADYCAPPFEITQLRWLIETHTSQGRLPAARERASASAAAA